MIAFELMVVGGAVALSRDDPVLVSVSTVAALTASEVAVSVLELVVSLAGLVVQVVLSQDVLPVLVGFATVSVSEVVPVAARTASEVAMSVLELVVS